MNSSPLRQQPRLHHRVSQWPNNTLVNPLRHNATQDLTKNISLVSTNHERVYAAHDREHSCYNSFTLWRGCTYYPWVVIILGSQIPVIWTEYPYTLPRCALGNHYKVVQWFHLACNIPTEISLPVWASHPPRSPLLCLMGSSRHSCTHTIPRFSNCSFTKHPNGSIVASSPHSQLFHQD
jgi:hypothetical protein